MTGHVTTRRPGDAFLLDTWTNSKYIGDMIDMMTHIHNRHVDTDLHRVWVDDESHVAVFPLWNLSGEMAGYQSYRPDADKVKKNDEYGRYYTYRGLKLVRNHNKTVAVWGLESWNLGNTLFVTEGIFDAARITKLGASAVAMLSNDPSPSARNWVECVRQNRPVVAVCDPGSAGRKLAKLGCHVHTMSVPGLPDADLGDAPLDYVKNLIECYR